MLIATYRIYKPYNHLPQIIVASWLAMLRLVSAENKVDPRTRVLSRKTLLLKMLTITPPP